MQEVWKDITDQERLQHDWKYHKRNLSDCIHRLPLGFKGHLRDEKTGAREKSQRAWTHQATRRMAYGPERNSYGADHIC